MKKKYVDILLIAVAVLLNACSSDDSGAQTDSMDYASTGKTVQLVSYISPLVEKELSHRAAPTGFSLYTPDKTITMGIYMLLQSEQSDWDFPEEKRITYNTGTGKWNASFEVEAGKTYSVYGYMPKAGGVNSSLTVTSDGDTLLSITGIKPVTTDDICIITGVKETDEGLKEGLLSWKWPIPSEDENFKIHILMDHLYAAAQFRLKIDADYASLRTIKLKKMELSTDEGGSVNATISLTRNDTGSSPITDITYSLSGTSGAAEIFSSEEGTALDKLTPLAINACFTPLPTLSENLTLVSTYDVYDRKGNLIRQNCTATNKLPNLEAIRGQRIQLNMTVNPTYLYVLSEPDLDNPTITIGN